MIQKVQEVQGSGSAERTRTCVVPVVVLRECNSGSPTVGRFRLTQYSDESISLRPSQVTARANGVIHGVEADLAHVFIGRR